MKGEQNAIEDKLLDSDMDEPGTRLQARPYYDPDTFNAGYSAVFKPDQGVVDPNGQTIASKLRIVQSSGKRLAKGISSDGSPSGSLLSGLSIGNGKKLFNRTTNGDNGDSHKSIGDMEWGDFLNVKAWRKILGQLCDQFLRKYFRHLIQQPFEVARCILQVGDFSDLYVPGKDISAPVELRNEEDEEIDFFPRANDKEVNPQLEEDEQDKELVDEAQSYGSGNDNELLIKPESIHTLDIMNTIMDHEGIRGLWKANNTTFIYNFLSLTLDAWFTGLFSPFLGVPDPYFMEIIHSPDLKSSIFLTLSASTFTRLILLPLDIIRTRFIVTSIQRNNRTTRSLRELVRRWSWRNDGFKIPMDMWILTALQSVSNITFTKLFDVFIYHQLNVEKHSQIRWYHSLKLASQTIELFVKLPLENLLRRCQVNFLIKNNRNSLRLDKNDLIIKPIKYEGVWSSVKNKNTAFGLWSGWRVGLMSLVCGYGFEMMNIDAVDLEQEKF